MSHDSVCVSTVLTAVIHPSPHIQISHSTINGCVKSDLLKFPQKKFHNISKKLGVGIYHLLPVNSPLGSFPEWIPDSYTAQLSCWPAVPAATSTLSLHTLTTEPHPGSKSLCRVNFPGMLVEWPNVCLYVQARFKPYQCATHHCVIRDDQLR